MGGRRRQASLGLADHAAAGRAGRAQRRWRAGERGCSLSRRRARRTRRRGERTPTDSPACSAATNRIRLARRRLGSRRELDDPEQARGGDRRLPGRGGRRRPARSQDRAARQPRRNGTGGKASWKPARDVARTTRRSRPRPARDRRRPWWPAHCPAGPDRSRLRAARHPGRGRTARVARSRHRRDARACTRRRSVHRGRADEPEGSQRPAPDQGRRAIGEAQSRLGTLGRLVAQEHSRLHRLALPRRWPTDVHRCPLARRSNRLATRTGRGGVGARARWLDAAHLWTRRAPRLPARRDAPLHTARGNGHRLCPGRRPVGLRRLGEQHPLHDRRCRAGPALRAACRRRIRRFCSRPRLAA